MTFQEKIQADLKAAMKGGHKDAVRTLRMLIAALKNRRIETMRDLTEEEALRVVQTAVKQRKEAAAQYAEAGREELAQAEQAEIAVLEAYLPDQVSEEELEKIVDGAIAELSASGMKDMGAVMKRVLAQCAGRAEGALVSAKVREKLA